MQASILIQVYISYSRLIYCITLLTPKTNLMPHHTYKFSQIASIDMLRKDFHAKTAPELQFILHYPRNQWHYEWCAIWTLFTILTNRGRRGNSSLTTSETIGLSQLFLNYIKTTDKSASFATSLKIVSYRNYQTAYIGNNSPYFTVEKMN